MIHLLASRAASCRQQNKSGSCQAPREGGFSSGLDFPAKKYYVWEPLPAVIGKGLLPTGPQESLGRGEFYLPASPLPRMALDSMLFPEHTTHVGSRIPELGRMLESGGLKGWARAELSRSL